jgi:hypothetical protein
VFLLKDTLDCRQPGKLNTEEASLIFISENAQTLQLTAAVSAVRRREVQNLADVVDM